MKDILGDDVDLENLGKEQDDRAAYEAKQAELLGIDLYQGGAGGSPSMKKKNASQDPLDAGAGAEPGAAGDLDDLFADADMGGEPDAKKARVDDDDDDPFA